MPEGTGERAPVSAVDEVALLRVRLDRAEHATAWLRARLRAERLRRRSAPALDADALAADLARELAHLGTHDEGSVARMVRRVLAAQGLPIATPLGSPSPPGTPIGDSGAPRALPGWPRDQQEAVAAQVLARAPEVANPLYVYRTLALIAGEGGGTLGRLTRASGLDSAMGKRRLRLALDALVALGALVVRDGTYTLNTEYRPAQPRPRQGQLAGASQTTGRPGDRGVPGQRRGAATRPRR